jgi:hypothetical protein
MLQPRNSSKRTTSPNLVKIGMTAVKKMEKKRCKRRPEHGSIKPINPKQILVLFKPCAGR